MLERGSEWGVWDLHIHTPASFHWNGGRRFSEMKKSQRQSCVRSIVQRLNDAAPVAFATQDYWTFDGYKTINQEIEEQGLDLQKGLFPGIELRVSSPTKFRLNFHVLFSPLVPQDRLEQFVHALKLTGRGDAPIRSNLAAVGRDLSSDKWDKQGFDPTRRREDAQAWGLGVRTATVTAESVEEALRKFARTEYVVVQPFDTSDGLKGLEWEQHCLEAQHFSRLADFFEAKDPRIVELCHGIKTDRNSRFFENWMHNMGGHPKPVVRGSDAHRIEDYGVFPNNKRTWFKGRPTFDTLMHAMADPVARNWIGDEHPQVARIRKSKTKVMRSITLKPREGADPETKWFDQSVPLNSGLVVVIGNKGTGKSALADCVALATNANTNTYSFLTKDRFRSNPDPSKEFEARVDWLAGAPSTKRLSEDYDRASAERARYLTQQFVEKICNNIDDQPDSDFERALQAVILRHLPPEVRRDSATLRQVMTRVALPHSERITALRQRLSEANRQIVSLMEQISTATRVGLNNRLKTLHAELEAHRQTRPSEVAQPDPADPERQAALAQLHKLRAQLEEAEEAKRSAEQERRVALGRLTHIEALRTALEELQAKLAEARDDLQEQAADFDLNIEELVRFSIDLDAVEAKVTATRAIVAEHGSALDEEVEDSVAYNVRTLRAAIEAQRQQLTEEQERFETYQASLAEYVRVEATIVGDEETPETIRWIETRLEAMDTELPKKLAETTGKRDQISREIHDAIAATRRAWAELFEPIQEFADTVPVAKSQAFQFAVSLSYDGVQERLFRLISHKRRGEFHGVEAARTNLSTLIAPHDLSTADGALDCAKAIWQALAGADNNEAHSQAAGQLRRDVEVVEVLDLLFGFEYLKPFYTLTRGGTPLKLLSPGERGAVLLIFYLLVDPDNMPLIVDQPEQNLDNETVFEVLVPCFREARKRRQVIMVTHNPNLAVVCDADQVIRASFDRSTHKIRYTAGGLEDAEVAQGVVDVLEGTLPAFEQRRGRYVYCGGSR